MVLFTAYSHCIHPHHHDSHSLVTPSYSSTKYMIRIPHMPHASSFQPLQVFHAVQYSPLARLLYLAPEDVLVKNGVHLVEVKHNVQLAHIAEELVKDAHEQVDCLHEQQLIVCHIGTEAEVQTSIPAVNELICVVLLCQNEREGRVKVSIREEKQRFFFL